ncbi:MAG: flavodoxin [Bacilli bacterium]|nr:flavodoxin [Bacilli bacterium]
MKDKKSLIIYFSRADENYSVGYITKGNTQIIAEYISEITNGDLFKVEPVIPYSKDYNKCIEEAKVRTSTHNAPIKESIPDISDYEVIYIGSPIYWGGMPEELFTALKEKDFTGKIIRVFTTHEGSGLASVPSQIKNICNGANILDDAIAIRGSQALNSKKQILEWI